MKLQNEIKVQSTRFSKELRLPAFRNEYEQIAQESAKDNADYETFLLRLITSIIMPCSISNKLK